MFHALVGLSEIVRDSETRKTLYLVYMVLFMMKSHLLRNRFSSSQPSLFLSGILKGVSVETPETPLDPPLYGSPI